jgi:hypothetical protein
VREFVELRRFEQLIAAKRFHQTGDRFDRHRGTPRGESKGTARERDHRISILYLPSGQLFTPARVV